MACTIKGTTIRLTQGDTLVTKITITNGNTGEEYIPIAQDVIRFAVKKEATDKRPLLVKEIPYDTMILRLESSDTNTLKPDEYRYDVEITLSDGTVDTIINSQKLIIVEQIAN